MFIKRTPRGLFAETPEHKVWEEHRALWVYL